MKPVELERFIERLKRSPRLPEPEPEYVCAACKDAGWVQTDDGLEDGRRVRAPQEARCTSIAHQRPKPVERPEREVERFT